VVQVGRNRHRDELAGRVEVAASIRIRYDRVRIRGTPCGRQVRTRDLLRGRVERRLGVAARADEAVDRVHPANSRRDGTQILSSRCSM
jgi:hypothetical protein